MQPRDKNVSFEGEPDAGGAGGGTAGAAGGAQEPDPAGQDSIRERQRRRRNAGRTRTDMTAILSRPDDAEEEDEEEEEAPAGPPPARVFVVFRGVSWEDPQGGLRESDSIQGVFASEEAARRAVAALEREGGAGAESWYQPYPVQD